MARKRYTEERIIGVLQEAEARTKVAEMCRSTASVRRRTSTGG
jgi:hypothetical protein